MCCLRSAEYRFHERLRILLPDPEHQSSGYPMSHHTKVWCSAGWLYGSFPDQKDLRMLRRFPALLKYLQTGCKSIIYMCGRYDMITCCRNVLYCICDSCGTGCCSQSCCACLPVLLLSLRKQNLSGSSDGNRCYRLLSVRNCPAACAESLNT